MWCFPDDVSRWAQLVSSVCKSIFFDLFWGQNKAFRFFLIFSKREKVRDFLDLPLVADVEPSDFDFLHAGLALSDVSRVCLLLLTGVLTVDVFAVLMNW